MINVNDIVHSAPHDDLFFVLREIATLDDGSGAPVAVYSVYVPYGSLSRQDSAYPQTDDGLSIAIARCDYLAKRKAAR